MLIPRVCAGFHSCSVSNNPALLIAAVAFTSADLASYGAARAFQKEFVPLGLFPQLVRQKALWNYHLLMAHRTQKAC